MSKRPYSKRNQRTRPLIALFDYPDVFEDFYPHYGASQQAFATQWADTANHAWVELVQREIGDVIWYELSLAPELSGAHHRIGCEVRFLRSSLMHRFLWTLFYRPTFAWRWRRFYRPFATLASYLALLSFPVVRALVRERPDALFVQSYASGKYDILLLLARLLGIPVLAFHSGEQPECYLGKPLRRWTIPQANWMFPSGNAELEMLANRYGVARERMNIIRPPVDMAVYRPVDRTEACQRHHLDPRRRYLIFVGRLEDQVKRVSAIISAFAKLVPSHGDVDLLIVGDGADRERLEQHASREAAGRVRFVGWVSSPEQKAELYAIAECLVLASWREASPAVISEAFACGTPVTASNVGAISDLVIPCKSGWLFEPGDDCVMTSSLGEVLADPARISAMRPVCRQIALEQVSPQAVVAALKVGFSRTLHCHA